MSLKFLGFLHIFLKMFQVYTLSFFPVSANGIIFFFPFQTLIFKKDFVLVKVLMVAIYRDTLLGKKKKKKLGGNSLEGGQGVLCSLRAEGGVGLTRGPGNNCLVSLCCFSE